jgi:hypothetical protein
MVERFPDNTCFILEGREYSSMDYLENNYWSESFEKLGDNWIMIAIATSPNDGATVCPVLL